MSVNTYQSQDGKTHASLNVIANDIEFLSSRNDASSASSQEENPVIDEQSGMVVVETDELPF